MVFDLEGRYIGNLGENNKPQVGETTMKFKILGALIAAPVIAFSGLALADSWNEIKALGIDAISFDDSACIVYLGEAGGIEGESGRLLVKFDVKNFTVSASCIIFAFEGSAPSEALVEEDFDCFVQISRGNDHYHQILYWNDSEVRNKKRFRKGRATLSCSGPYDPDQIIPPPE